MSVQRIVIDTVITADDFKSVCNLAPLGRPALQSLEQYFCMLGGGLQSTTSLKVLVGAVKAAGTVTFSSTGPANNETMTICGVTFTAKTSATLANEFTVSATPATVATNLAAAINASASVAGMVTATSLLGAVTITCVVPGTIGNGLVVAVGTLANTVVVTPAGGLDGTEYSL